MQISSLSPSVAATAASQASTVATRIPSKTLGQEDFLKLLAVQFQKQDPMKPMEDTSFIAQMAQFTALDQSSAMGKDIAALRSDQQRTVANSYLGLRVTVDAGDGTMPAGLVSAIDASGSAPQLVIDGYAYPLSAVLQVESGKVITPTLLPVSPGGA